MRDLTLPGTLVDSREADQSRGRGTVWENHDITRSKSLAGGVHLAEGTFLGGVCFSLLTLCGLRGYRSVSSVDPREANSFLPL